MLLNVRDRGVHIDTPRVVERTVAIADTDNRAALSRHEFCRGGSDVAESLYRHRSPVHLKPKVCEGFPGYQHATTTRGLAAPV